ncbi:MAG: hypothetical protein HOK52_06800 [Candidatus Marinimicrobia bacterium]|mgnify:CR=1 FL=1|jgi:hypothetical protein|nr:hypothetical protein [Candidatus Neomarinimicrobiota bacterium]
MGRFSQGDYTVKNTKKYVGKGVPKYRSSWELDMFRFCDTNPHILEWASEPIRIPYFNPFKGKKTTYVPDLLIKYKNKQNIIVVELIEIKPKKQSMITEKSNSKDRMIVQLNHAKWEQAVKWCALHSITFRVVTEDQLYHNGRKSY